MSRYPTAVGRVEMTVEVDTRPPDIEPTRQSATIGRWHGRALAPAMLAGNRRTKIMPGRGQGFRWRQANRERK